MDELIQARIQTQEAHIRHLREKVDEQLSVEARRRHGATLRFLHYQLKAHELAVSELKGLLSDYLRARA